MDTAINISAFSADELERRLPQFAALLYACVHGGASIGFVLPFSQDDSDAFWRRKILPAMRAGGVLLLAAQRGGHIAGTVQLDYATPANQLHRAEARKLLVHPEFRRQGIAQALMAELERHAGVLGRTLITLDTRTGDAAEPLYAGLGYQTAGVIPGYCRDPHEARLDSTTLMYKHL
jgi:ribosomal protein S18 acetylase RimI-like enzyme